MKVELAENQSEITLGQYQEFMKLGERKDLNGFEFSKRKVKIFTGLTYQHISLMKHSDLEDMIRTIDSSLNKEVKFESTFKMNGVEFGFIPNFDDIKAKEYFDLSTYDTEIETLHKLMAILFRPIKDKVGNEYEVVNYQGSNEWGEVMKRTPLHIVNGALVFFLNLVRELEIYTLKSTVQQEAKKKQMDTLKNGGGMRQFTKWLKVRFGSLKPLKI
jgi:hypothetical protein